MRSWGPPPSSPLLFLTMCVAATVFLSPPTPSRSWDAFRSSRPAPIPDCANMWTSPEGSMVWWRSCFIEMHFSLNDWQIIRCPNKIKSSQGAFISKGQTNVKQLWQNNSVSSFSVGSVKYIWFIIKQAPLKTAVLLFNSSQFSVSSVSIDYIWFSNSVCPCCKTSLIYFSHKAKDNSVIIQFKFCPCLNRASAVQSIMNIKCLIGGQYKKVMSVYKLQ